MLLSPDCRARLALCIRVCISLVDLVVHTPRHTSTPSGPGAPLLQTPHLSRDLASSGVRFPLRSLRTLSPARRRARRAPRPPRRSAMARARSRALTAPGPRGPPGSRSFAEIRLLRPAPPEQTAPSPKSVWAGEWDRSTNCPSSRARGCALQGSSPPRPPSLPPSSPAPLPRSRGPSSWPWPRYVYRPPEAPGDPLVRVLEDLKLGLHKWAGKQGQEGRPSPGSFQRPRPGGGARMQGRSHGREWAWS